MNGLVTFAQIHNGVTLYVFLDEYFSFHINMSGWHVNDRSCHIMHINNKIVSNVHLAAAEDFAKTK